MIHSQISFYYKDGSSDKVYHAQIVQKDDLYVVDFQYGRRGSTLTPGTKTKSPVTLEVAEKAFQTVIRERIAKGYTEGESSAIFQSVDLADRITGISPQLLNNLSDDELLKFIQDDEWMMQEKHDGRRLMFKKTKDEATAINKKGLSIAVPESVSSLIQSVPEDVLVDGEIIGENYYIFDILEYNGKDLRSQSAKERFEVLASIPALKDNVVETYFNTQDKTAFFEKLKEAKREGAVFKKIGSAYVPGRPASGGNQRKYKFWASLTAKVMGQHKTKRSVNVGLYKDGELVDMGKVTIPANYDIPDVNAYVEVVYLYCEVGGKLYQSKYKGIRDDQDDTDCGYGQVKFKAVGNLDDEDE